jgi:cytoskeleton protein RodZ
VCWGKAPSRRLPRSRNRHNVWVDIGIGATLREARARRKLDLTEVEAAIKIRVRYLQAIENEEWDALPGGAYTRGFIRTYAVYLGLDGDRLADDYRRSTMPAGGERAPRRIEPVPATARGHRPRLSGRVLAVGVSLVLVALVVGIGLSGGSDDDGGGSSGPAPASGGGQQARQQDRTTTTAAARSGVEVELAATAEVWVCLLDAREEPLVEGEILEEGAGVGPFRSKSFEIALGNGSVDMLVDGEPASVAESSSPVGYSVNSDGDLIALEEGERPDCE